jgi:hypothetical protein
MRCTRCDRIVFEEILARDAEGRLVFGWCEACVKSTGCELVKTGAVELSLKQSEPIGRRVRRYQREAKRAVQRSRTEEASRRLAAMGIAGLMMVWAMILAFVGGIKLIGATDTKGPWLLVAAGAMAVVSLIVWVAMIGRAGGFRVILKIVQVAGAIAGFGTLILGILENRREKAGLVVLISTASFSASWIARAIERRHQLATPARRVSQYDGGEEADSTADESTR